MGRGTRPGSDLYKCPIAFKIRVHRDSLAPVARTYRAVVHVPGLTSCQVFAGEGPTEWAATRALVRMMARFMAVVCPEKLHSVRELAADHGDMAV